MVWGRCLVAGGMLGLALWAGCASSSRSVVRTPAEREVNRSVASDSTSSNEDLGEESFRASEKQIDNDIDQVLASRGVTKDEVIALTKANIDPNVIINHIRSRGVPAPLSSEDLITLKENGVDSRVVAAMQVASTPPQRTVVVRDHYVPTIVGVRPMFGPPTVYYPIY